MEHSTDYNGYKRVMTTAILVDGGFYRKRANHYIGLVSPKVAAETLMQHCFGLLYHKYEQRNLYRIFYYDCPPIDKNIYNPITKRSIYLGRSDEYKWMTGFLKELKHQRKVALRLGRLSENTLEYNLKAEVLRDLINGTKKIDELTEGDLYMNIEQKGVDMRIGVDISSLAFKKQVNQIILISGDSDFVPAAKQARREGIDFILNSLGAPIKPDLYEHIDGLMTRGVDPLRPKDKDESNTSDESEV